MKSLGAFLFVFCGLTTAQTPPVVQLQKNKPQSIYDLTLEELMGISVITAASGFEQSLDKTFVSNTVVTKEEWQAFGALTLADVLKNIPGLDYGKSAIRPVYRPSIRGLGGNSAEQIKLLIDGRPIERLTDGAWPFGFRLPMGGFKRVEVIRGPGSAIYGADAFGGVINVVSEKLEDIEPEVSVNFGAFDTTQLAAQWAYKGTQQQLSLSLNFLIRHLQVNLQIDLYIVW